MDFSYDIGWLPNRIKSNAIFKIFKSAGINTISYNFYCINNLSDILDLANYINNAKVIKESLKENGIICNQTYSPYSLKLCDERLNRFEENYGELVRALEFSAIIGAKRMVVYAVQVPPEADGLEKNHKIYKSLIPYCEKFGIEIAVCSDFPKYMKSSVFKTPWATVKEYTDFISSFNSQYIGACLDLCSAASFDISPEECIRSVGVSYLKSIHFKDAEKYRDIHLPSFSEQFNFKRIREELEKIGYSGELTFECPSFLKKYPNELLEPLCNLFADIGYFVTGRLKGEKG